LNLLKDDNNVLVHCHGGHGRTGIVVVGCLVRLGKGAKEAYRFINKIRSIIDTKQQFRFLDVYERFVSKLRRENDIKRGPTRNSK
jgi:protein-tyrosine phosphatase